MKTSTTPFPSALCEASYISYMREEGDANGYVTPANSLLGYMLINDVLVSETFAQLVLEDIGVADFDYRCNYKVTDIFSDDFLNSLEADERELLMPVVLQLIARGKFPLCIWTDPENDEDTACDA